MHKICHLTSVHPPFDTRIFHKECKTLVEAGYEVVLIAKHQRDEVVDGIRIRALPEPKNRIERMTETVWKLYKKALAENADIYHFHDPELIPVGLLLKHKGKKVIYDVHEDVPRQILSKYWIPGPCRKFVAWAVEKTENLAARFLSAIVAATSAIAARFVSKNKNTFIVQNFPMLDEFKNNVKHANENRENFSGRTRAVVYVGGIAANRGIFEMVKAVELVAFKRDVRLFLGGKFETERLENEVKAMPGWEHVEFLGWVGRREVAEVFSKSQAGLVLLHPEPRYMVAYPVKLFEYMSAGLPVVASNFPLWKEIVEGNGCGLTVDPLNPGQIAQAIEYLLEHPDEAKRMGENGQRAVLEKYNWEKEAQKLQALYEELLGVSTAEGG